MKGDEYEWDKDRSRDLSGDQWLERHERRLLACNITLFVHYLLPHLPAYRKAKALSIGERAYYYRIGEAIDDLAHMAWAWRAGRRFALTRAGGVQP